jgi:hypothetical protein
MSDESKHKIVFQPSGRGKAQCAPDPDYPHGKAMPKLPFGQRQCYVELPYPAPECGYWMVTCEECKCAIAITAAGRTDDPISFYMPCIPKHPTTLNPGEAQGVCQTTSTERFYNPECKCPTYPGNLGPCAEFVAGGNGRCVYCDHETDCHKALEDIRKRSAKVEA